MFIGDSSFVRREYSATHFAALYVLNQLPAACGRSRKYPKAPYEWAWKFVFPSHRLSVDPRSGVIRRHHVYENYVIRGVKQAAFAARIANHVSCHTLRARST
jgi:integrase